MKQADNIILFGIPNCDTVKKARTWLDEAGITFTFFNFKKENLTTKIVEQWLTQLNLATLINRKGTTWRALNDEQKLAAESHDTAIALILAFPSIIKRPVLQMQSQQKYHCSVGFKADMFEQIFK